VAARVGDVWLIGDGSARLAGSWRAVSWRAGSRRACFGDTSLLSLNSC
jgi:hypothetical protein